LIKSLFFFFVIMSFFMTMSLFFLMMFLLKLLKDAFSRETLQNIKEYIIRHLMTGPKGNSEFFFPETLNVPCGEAEGNSKNSQLKTTAKKYLLDTSWQCKLFPGK